jgi:hypothetical protein
MGMWRHYAVHEGQEKSGEIMVSMFRTFRRGGGKMKKQEAFELVKRLQAKSKEEATQRGLEELYKFFLPSAPVGGSKNPLTWVFKASKGATNKDLKNRVFSDGEFLFSTDGSRLHAVKNGDYPVGVYDTGMEPIPDQAPVPDWRRLLLKDTEKYTVKITDLPLVEDSREIPWVYHLPCGRIVSQAFFADLVDGVQDITYEAMESESRLGPIQIIKDGRIGMLMPLSGSWKI